MALDWFLERTERKHPERLESAAGKATTKQVSYWLSVAKKILLGLSDTQLLTGIGMQFTTLIDHCTLSIYHFLIAVNLAYMSTITHLMTMAALRNYFLEHRLSSIPRVVLIVFNVGLFCYEAFVGDALGFSNNVGDASQSLACYYKGNRPSLKISGFRGSWIPIVVLVIAIHVTLLYNVFQARKKDRRKKWWQRWLLRLPIVFAWAYMIYALVVLSLSVLPYTQAMGTPTVVLSGSEQNWDFGQLLPVLLLAIPLLAGWEAAVEVYAEKQRQRKSEISNTISEILQQQSSKQDIKPAWSNQDFSGVDSIELESNRMRKRDATSHGSYELLGQQESPHWRQNSGNF